mmetsp:Transcript_12518/g.31188  ORF Transcript_12518/g.31188 Transcript_12518/m.31188 type:complete len:388 (-) Transcript_12518:380-1543(-)
MTPVNYTLVLGECGPGLHAGMSGAAHEPRPSGRVRRHGVALRACRVEGDGPARAWRWAAPCRLGRGGSELRLDGGAQLRLLGLVEQPLEVNPLRGAVPSGRRAGQIHHLADQAGRGAGHATEHALVRLVSRRLRRLLPGLRIPGRLLLGRCPLRIGPSHSAPLRSSPLHRRPPRRGLALRPRHLCPSEVLGQQLPPTLLGPPAADLPPRLLPRSSQLARGSLGAPKQKRQIHPPTDHPLSQHLLSQHLLGLRLGLRLLPACTRSGLHPLRVRRLALARRRGGGLGSFAAGGGGARNRAGTSGAATDSAGYRAGRPVEEATGRPVALQAWLVGHLGRPAYSTRRCVHGRIEVGGGVLMTLKKGLDARRNGLHVRLHRPPPRPWVLSGG